MKQRYVHKYIEVHFPRERAKSVAFFHEKGLKARAGSSCYFLYDEKKKRECLYVMMQKGNQMQVTPEVQSTVLESK